LKFYDGALSLVECSWESDDGESGSSGPCIIDAPDGRFNGELLTITIFITSDYTCTGIGCWFEYECTGSVNDTTT